MKLICASILFLLGWEASRGWAADVFLVAAGNNLGDADESPLSYAEQEASQIASVMQRLGGVPAQNSVLLLGEDASAFRKVLLEVNARIRNESGAAKSAEHQSVLLVYYSGHADATGLHMGQSRMPFDELKAMVAGSPATMRLLVLDACRSGGMTRVKGVRQAPEFDIQWLDSAPAEGVAIITSSAAGEDSYESDQIKASFFSHHWLNALRGAADINQDGVITLNEAYQYAYQQTLRSSGHSLKLQHPTYQFDIKGRGNLVLTRLANDHDRSGRLILPQPGTYLVFEKSQGGILAAEVNADQAGTTLVLPPGSYFVQQRANRYFLEYQIGLVAGQDVDLDDVPHQTVEYARLIRKGGGTRQTILGVFMLGGLRSPILPGEAATPQVVVGTSLDASWLSFGLRGRFSQARLNTADGLTRSLHSEWGLDLTAQRFYDTPWFSVSLGLLLETTYHNQHFRTSGVAPERSSWSFGFGGLLSLERELLSSLSIMIEGGPIAYLFLLDPIEEGAESGKKTANVLTWWLAAGLGWRF